MWDLFSQALMITGFVSVMMLTIEYFNVLSEGRWQDRLAERAWGQYLLAAFLGATPGCLGAFAVVAMYAHRRLSIGAVVAAMIATAGDESFVLFALVPRMALLLIALLFVVGTLAGALTDRLFGRRFTNVLPCNNDFRVHADEVCGSRLFSRGDVAKQWRNCTPARGLLSVGLLFFLAAAARGQIGPPAWNWIRVTLVTTSGVALFIVATVPDHFLEEHLWRHVVLGHVSRIFLWSFGALVVLHFATARLDVGELVEENRWAVLAIAGLIGLIPESGPHLIFVTLFAQGALPFGILLASSIVQDGHGMLPMLAHSRRAFLFVKLVNLAVGWTLGAAALALGF